MWCWQCSCNQGYKARVLENGHHPHVLLLFEDLIEDDWQARAEWPTWIYGGDTKPTRDVFTSYFFYIMQHLMIHMVHQIQALGPCYLHEMWSYEWFMSVLSRYMYNRAYLEGSMIEGYSTKEVIECCQEYLKVQKGIDKPDSCHKGRLAGRALVVEKCS